MLVMSWRAWLALSHWTWRAVVLFGVRTMQLSDVDEEGERFRSEEVDESGDKSAY